MKTITLLIFFILSISNAAWAIELKAVGVTKKKATSQDLLRSHLDLVSFRHKILSENLANLNTPGYKANEVKMPSTIEELASGNNKGQKKIALKTTSKRHMTGRYSTDSNHVSHKLKDPLEVKQNGNNVSLAQQVNKLSQNQSAYDTGLKISASTNSLISTILGK